MEKRNIVRNQKGFTLIEIIAVLVILGILAAVAVPKYMDMTTQANIKAVAAAEAAATSNITMAFADKLLTDGTTPTMAALKTALDEDFTDLGDYTVVYTATGSGISYVLTAKASSGITIPTVGDTTGKGEVVLIRE